MKTYRVFLVGGATAEVDCDEWKYVDARPAAMYVAMIANEQVALFYEDKVCGWLKVQHAGRND